jgi:hypothetical protein
MELRQPIAASELFVAVLTGSVFFSNPFHLLPCQDAGVSPPPLIVHVGVIISFGSQEQMIGIATGRLITPMKNA